MMVVNYLFTSNNNESNDNDNDDDDGLASLCYIAMMINRRNNWCGRGEGETDGGSGRLTRHRGSNEMK